MWAKTSKVLLVYPDSDLFLKSLSTFYFFPFFTIRTDASFHDARRWSRLVPIKPVSVRSNNGNGTAWREQETRYQRCKPSVTNHNVAILLV